MKSSTEDLFAYGILEEDSTVRAHVGVLAQCVYVFQTQAARAFLLDKGHFYPPRPAGQPGVNGWTGLGHPIPWKLIPGVRCIPYTSYTWTQFQRSMTTTEKGRQAVECVCQLMKAGRFPCWIEGNESSDSRIQIRGTDMIVWHKIKIQVKCDWEAGDGPGCTGNLYLQIKERNPLRRH